MAERIVNSLDTAALRLLSKKLDEWIKTNTETLAFGGSKVQGDLNATGLLYSEACGYIRALVDIKTKLCGEVEAELRGKK